MNLYERSVAAGIDPRTAERDQWADDMQKFNNREKYAREQAQDGLDYTPIAYADRRGI